MTSSENMNAVVNKVRSFCRERQTGENRDFFVGLGERLEEIGAREGEENSVVATENQYVEALSSLLLLVNGPTKSTLQKIIKDLSEVTDREITSIDVRFGSDGDPLSFQEMLPSDRTFNAVETSAISFIHDEIMDVVRRRSEGS